MVNINAIVQKAKTSPFYLKVLNYGLRRVVPFNRPHGYKITKIGQYEIETFVPYKRLNLNHIKGLHACSLATLAEFTTGFLLLCNLNMNKYRLIMQKIAVEYFYQGKMGAKAKFSISDEWIKINVIDPIELNGVALVNCEVNIYDEANNHLCKGFITWQIKDWSKVKTKVN